MLSQDYASVLRHFDSHFVASPSTNGLGTVEAKMIYSKGLQTLLLSSLVGDNKWTATEVINSTNSPKRYINLKCYATVHFLEKHGIFYEGIWWFRLFYNEGVGSLQIDTCLPRSCIELLLKHFIQYSEFSLRRAKTGKSQQCLSVFMRVYYKKISHRSELSRIRIKCEAKHRLSLLVIILSKMLVKIYLFYMLNN